MPIRFIRHLTALCSLLLVAISAAAAINLAERVPTDPDVKICKLCKGAGDRMQRQLLPEMYNRSRYADRLPGGQESILKTFKPDAARRFYADWYRPDLMAVVVVGDIQPAQAEKMIIAHFGKLKNP